MVGDIDADRRVRLAGRLRGLVDEHVEEESDEQRKQALFIQLFPICAADFAQACSIRRSRTEPAAPRVVPDVLVL